MTVSGRLDQRSWENQDGDKRSKVEIVADDVAVSLRWATADVARNERANPGDGSAAGMNQPNQAKPAHNPNEEPF